MTHNKSDIPKRQTTSNDSISHVAAYHELSKHQFDRFAPSPGYLDWATQPNPFRRYVGAPPVALDRNFPDDTPFYDGSLCSSAQPARALNASSIAQLFFDSLSLSAWKSAGGEPWALRVNPSSGNLHPTEGYLITGSIDGLTDAPSVYHYMPYTHGLEQRAVFPTDLWKQLSDQFPQGTVFVGLTSIHWREAWKYGERAFRYCNHDVGHAIAALDIAAAGLGWTTLCLDSPATQQLAALFGVFDPSTAEPEEPDCLIAVNTLGKPLSPAAFPNEIFERFRTLEWQGYPNQLSPSHVEWKHLDTVALHTRKQYTDPHTLSKTNSENAIEWKEREIPLRHLVRQRRSAVAMDAQTHISADEFYTMMTKLVPTDTLRPFNCLVREPMVHLIVFVHRVEGLQSGVYCLVRNTVDYDELRSLMRHDFGWMRPPSCPEYLPFFMLGSGDVREFAQKASCFQDIASDGCFTVAMLARFCCPLQEYGAWFYTRLFWETGMIGQILYLEAEAAGIRGTGIGCFFDDAVHEILGLEGTDYQDLYHFTVGGHRDDLRIQSKPAYSE